MTILHGDDRFYNNIFVQKWPIIVDKETGETKTEEKDVVMFENVVEDDFTRIFDCNNSRWENDFLMNDNFIRTHIDWYTHHLQAHRMNHVRSLALRRPVLVISMVGLISLDVL